MKNRIPRPMRPTGSTDDKITHLWREMIRLTETFERIINEKDEEIRRLKKTKEGKP